MITREDVDAYVATRPEATHWIRPYDTTRAVADMLLLHAPLDTWTTPEPPADLLPPRDIDSVIADLTRPTIHWTRTKTVDIAELLIEAVPVETREIDNTTIEWVTTNAHAEIRQELLDLAGLPRAAVLQVSIYQH